jgi:hypothetical protein
MSINRFRARSYLVSILILATSSVLLAAASFAQPQVQPSASQEDSLRQVLRDYLKDSGGDKTARYVSAFVDLRDDGRQEVIVYVTDQHFCGSGGCTALILAPEGSSYRLVTGVTLARLPIRVLRTKSNGWHDLGIWVQGGGVQQGYEARLSFDGETYPRNPSVPPASRIAEKPAGEIVIPVNAKGKFLYQ